MTAEHELIAAQFATVGKNQGAAATEGPGRGHKNAVPVGDHVLPPTLADAGISKKLSSEALKGAPYLGYPRASPWAHLWHPSGFDRC